MKNWQLTKEQYLEKKYSYMKERVTNPRKVVGGRHYLGLPICDRASFVKFGMSNKAFNRLFTQYKRSRGTRRVAPSVDRINSRRGYTLDNIQFVTVSQNTKLEVSRRWVKLQNMVTDEIHRFLSLSEAGRFLGQSSHIKAASKVVTDVLTGVKFRNLTR